MGISLIADSSCDLPIEIINKYNIIIVPVSIYFPHETRTQYIDITTEEFFHKITTENLSATTGVPSPKWFKKAFDEALEKNDEAIMLCLSSELSGIHSSALLHSKNMTNNKVTVVDIRTTTVPFGLIVLKVARMIENGLSKQDILDNITNNLIPNIQLNAFVGTLKYLKRSGRIATLQHILGELLQFKPLITIIDGKLESFYRVRGEEATIEFLEKLGEKVVEMLPENETLIIVHSRNFEKAQNLEKHLLMNMNKHLEILLWEIGPAIGVHVGPGALGLTWIGKPANEIYHFK
ncbi:MAG: DegV family protein [Candidatus Thorarchaeota archaeon]